MTKLADRARDILRTNDRGRYTVPAAHLYPHQWAWDSAFAALGWAHVDMERAMVELETLLAGQWADGRIPHIQFHQAGNYFPDQGFWETPVPSSSITQPPVWAMAMRRLLELGAPQQRIRALLPAVDRSHRFFHEHRDPLGWNAVAVAHPWESGLDNSPAWDTALQAVDPTGAPPFKRIDVTVVGDVSQRPTDEQYRRYAVLVKRIAENSFEAGTWAVYDPLMTALLARNEDDLAWLGGQLDVITDAAKRAMRLKSSLFEHLWNENLGRFTFFDAAAGQGVTPDVLAAYVPLCLDLPKAYATRLEAELRRKFWTEWPLPSTCPQDPAFDRRRYWRGPTWINMNWLLAPRLGTELVDRTLELLERQGFWEYFDPYSGEGLGAADFTWSAALALDLLHTP